MGLDVLGFGCFGVWGSVYRIIDTGFHVGSVSLGVCARSVGWLGWVGGVDGKVLKLMITHA